MRVCEIDEVGVTTDWGRSGVSSIENGREEGGDEGTVWEEVARDGLEKSSTSDVASSMT
jgi:hypothetical protein